MREAQSVMAGKSQQQKLKAAGHIQEAERDGYLLLFISVQNPSPWDGVPIVMGQSLYLRNFLTDMPQGFFLGVLLPVNSNTKL